MTAGPRLVVVIDDSQECAATIEIALGAIPGLMVSVAESAEHALGMLKGGNVVAVVTDLHLPGMNGLDLIASIRGDARWAGIPIFVISGDTDPATPERVRIAGATAFFPKPYSPLAVRHRLEELIDAR
jgi:DNA-binding response OmpR family regulator